MRTVPSRRPDHRLILWLAEEDVAAARRLLAVLDESDETSQGHKDRSKEPTEAGSRGRRQLLGRARWSLSLRQRRAGIFGKSFSAESPFAMLLALYVNEAREANMTASKLTELAWLRPTTAVHWLDELVSEGWITRTAVAADRRKSQIELTEKARLALNHLFSWPH